MVKSTGGKKTKSMARKNVHHVTSRAVRFSKDPAEIYGQVTKYLGSGRCYVMCSDVTTRMCIIRGKFKGRGKRDNKVESGTWVLVGLRTWASQDSGKMNECDLLEVYGESDKQQLRDKEVSINWNIFTTLNTETNKNNDETDDYLTFSNNASREEYDALMTQRLPPGMDTKQELNSEHPVVIDRLNFTIEESDEDSDVDIDCI